jgi:hypothetical protein
MPSQHEKNPPDFLYGMMKGYIECLFGISFSYKDYTRGSVTKLMTLEVDKFLGSFYLNILSPKFNCVTSFVVLEIRH